MPRFLIGALVAYVIVLPVFGALPVPGTIFGKSIRLADLAFLAVAGAFLAAGRSRRLPLHRGVAAAAGAVIAAVAISALRTGDHQATMEIARTVYSMVVLLVLAHLRLDDAERTRVLDAWIATALLLAVASLVAYVAVAGFGVGANPLAYSGSLNLGRSIVRAGGGMPAPTFAIYLTLAGALALGRAAGSRLGARASPVTLTVFLAASALTLSRAFVGMPVMLAIVARHRDGVPWLRAGRRWALGLAVLVIAGVMLVTLWPLGPDGLDPATNFYPLLHRAGVRMFLARPLLGLGAGEFERQWCAYTSAEERARGGPALRCAFRWRPHSVWIGAAAEGGLVLLGAWVGLFLAIFRALARSTLPVPRFAAAALVGLALDGFTVEPTFVKFVWAFFGLALSASGAAARSSPSPPA